MPLRLSHGCRQLRAMAVVHLPAVQLLIGAVGVWIRNVDLRFALANGLATAAGRGPNALGGSPVLHTMLQELLQVGPSLVLCPQTTWVHMLRLPAVGDSLLTREPMAPAGPHFGRMLRHFPGMHSSTSTNGAHAAGRAYQNWTSVCLGGLQLCPGEQQHDTATGAVQPARCDTLATALGCLK